MKEKKFEPSGKENRIKIDQYCHVIRTIKTLCKFLNSDKKYVSI